MSIIGLYRKLVVFAFVALWLGALVVSPAELAAGATRHAPEGDAFYVPPRPLPKAEPGTIIRSTSIPDAPSGARAWKILYHSRAVGGTDIAVSGVVIAPTGRAPRGGRPVVSWAHDATGLADLCAPSKQTDIASGDSGTSIGSPRALIPSVQTFLDAGYVVAATDYEGLGTPGLHPFLVGESEGRSVLDAARAAHGLKAAAASSKTLVFGHSQGGQAALFAGELAASYAPELRVLGIAAEAPISTDAELNFRAIGSVSAANVLAVMLVEAFHAAYPQFDPASLLTPEALSQASIVDQKCFADIAAAYPPSPDVALSRNPVDIPALAKILHTNSAGNRPAGAPLLVVQGSADTDLPQVVTDAFVGRACGAGSTVDYRVYAGATHLGVLDAAANDVATWFADRVSGAPATGTCS